LTRFPGVSKDEIQGSLRCGGKSAAFGREDVLYHRYRGKADSSASLRNGKQKAAEWGREKGCGTGKGKAAEWKSKKAAEWEEWVVFHVEHLVE